MRYFLILFLIASSVQAKEVCVKQTKAEFEKHAWANKTHMNANCAMFYKDTKKHTACWTDTRKNVKMTVSNVRCK